MSQNIDDRNKLAQMRAKKKGSQTFQKEISDTWPACVDCGAALRNHPTSMGGFRRVCLCKGRIWTNNYDGWSHSGAASTPD